MVNGLHERLKKMRQLSGLSQKAVAESLFVSTSIISAYETGERTPSAENLLALSYLYKCSTDYLLGRGAMSKYIDASSLSDEQFQLLTAFLKTIQN